MRGQNDMELKWDAAPLLAVRDKELSLHMTSWVMRALTKMALPLEVPWDFAMLALYKPQYYRRY